MYKKNKNKYTAGQIATAVAFYEKNRSENKGNGIENDSKGDEMSEPSFQYGEIMADCEDDFDCQEITEDCGEDFDCEMCLMSFEDMKKCGGYYGCLERRFTLNAEHAAAAAIDREAQAAAADAKHAAKIAVEQVETMGGNGLGHAAETVGIGQKTMGGNGLGHVAETVAIGQKTIGGNDSEQTAEAVSEFGKFKNAEELLRAYNALEAEFTKRCQRLKEVQSETDRLKAARAEVERLKAARTETDKFKAVQAETDRLKAAQAGVDEFKTARAESERLKAAQAEKYDAKADFLSFLDDEEFLDSVIVGNPKVRGKIIEGYLRAIEGNTSAKVLGGGRGRTALQPVTRPKTLEEAKKLANLLMGM